MTKINPINDMEQSRQRKSLTDSQKKNLNATQEGVVVNSCIKDGACSMKDIYDTMVISDDARLPEKIYDNTTTKEKSLAPISLIAVGVMATMTLISALAKKSAKVNLKLAPEKKLPSLTRNLAINDETHQAIYQMVQTPNQKTILAGVGVLTISAMAFMGKMFIDGFKDVWVKKREADIQKNLQERLIEVETQSFSGKIQIMRSMLAQKAREFSDYLSPNPKMPLAFKNFDPKLNFTANPNQQNKDENLLYFALGALTLGSIAGFGYLAMKNLRHGKKYVDDYIKASQSKISEIVSTSAPIAKENDKTNLKNLFQSIDAKPFYIKEELSKLKWNNAEKEKFIEEVTFNTSKSTAQADKAIGGDGTPKPAFYSHVNDYRAFLYNWLLETDNALFKNLFIGITGITAISYGGKVAGEAVKEVQVEKMNANTELELQQRLVSTELRNFKAKKDSAIDPLCDEFYAQLRKGKPKEELKTIAENILSEVKDGPPFVYS